MELILARCFKLLSADLFDISRSALWSSVEKHDVLSKWPKEVQGRIFEDACSSSDFNFLI